MNRSWSLSDDACISASWLSSALRAASLPKRRSLKYHRIANIDRFVIKPLELDNEQGQVIWETMCAADAGDTVALRRLLEKDPGLSRSEYWYQHPLHYAVRGGHLEAVKLLLDAGGDPEWNAYDGKLAAMARDRGHEEVAKLLDGACKEPRPRRSQHRSPDSPFRKARLDWESSCVSRCRCNAHRPWR